MLEFYAGQGSLTLMARLYRCNADVLNLRLKRCVLIVNKENNQVKKGQILSQLFVIVPKKGKG